MGLAVCSKNEKNETRQYINYTFNSIYINHITTTKSGNTQVSDQ